MIDVTRVFVRREPDVFCVTIFLAVVSRHVRELWMRSPGVRWLAGHTWARIFWSGVLKHEDMGGHLSAA